MTKYADTFDAVVLGNGGSLAPLTELVELIDANGRVRQVAAHRCSLINLPRRSRSPMKPLAKCETAAT